MKRLIRIELLKLQTIRTTYGLGTGRGRHHRAVRLP